MPTHLSTPWVTPSNRRTPRHIARGNRLGDVEAKTFSDRLANMLNYSKAKTLQDIVDEGGLNAG